MPAKQRDHRYRHVIESVYQSAWAILPGKLEEILALLDRRLEGPATEAELAAFPMDDGPDDDRGYRVTPGGVAVLSIQGTISQRASMFTRMSGGASTELIASAFTGALADASVRAIVLDVDSPGGRVSGVPELADLIYGARGTKPIVAVANTLMASAAYWIGSAADKVVASPSAMVGSIGAYWVHTEYSRADASRGISRKIISAGKWKTIGNEIEPLTEEAKGKLQQFVDASYTLFVESVARHRGTTAAKVVAGYGEGDVLFARDALTEGLVDRIATLGQVVEELEASAVKGAGAAVQMGTMKPESNASRGEADATLLLQASPQATEGVRNMDPRIIAALFAKGLISEQTEAAASVALGAYFAGRGEPVPSGEGAVAKIVASLLGPTKAPAAEATADPKANEDLVDAVAAKATAQIEANERHRQQTVSAACDLAGLDAEATRKVVALGLSYQDSIPKIKEAAAGRNGPIPRMEFSSGQAEIDKFAVVAQEALDARCLAAANDGWRAESYSKLSAGARSLVGMRLVDLAAHSLRVRGVRTEGMSPRQIAKMALSDHPMGVMAAVPFYTTGSFPELTLNSARKTLTRAYQEAPVSYRTWVRQGEPVADFKVHSIVKFGEASDLEVTPEGHDSPMDTGITDDREYFQVEKYSKVAVCTLEMLVNDDLSAWSRLPQMQGTAAARTFNKLVYNTLTSNPTMADGYALFDAANHGGNLLSGVAETPTVASLQKIQAVLRKQHGLNSDSLLNTPLRWLIVPVALEATARALLATITDPSLANPETRNIFYGQVSPVVEALLDANSTAYFYGAADNSQIDTFEIRFLQGEESPVIEDWWEPLNDSRLYKIRQTGAVVVVDYRGMVRDNGA